MRSTCIMALFALLISLLSLHAVHALNDGTASHLTRKRKLGSSSSSYSKDATGKKGKGGKGGKKGKKANGGHSSEENSEGDETEEVSDCDAACPCCNVDTFPEFAQLVAGAGSFAGCGNTPGEKCCIARQDAFSDFVALRESDPSFSTLFGYATAYMSYDYHSSAARSRCNTGQSPCSYCGDSSSNVEFLTASEATICESVIRSKIDGSC